MSSSYFVSDLHLFSRRSSADLLEPKFRSAIENAHTFVLGGDIFDFRWSRHQTLKQAVDESLEWLQRMVEINPNCNIHYLLGNHDCHPEFVEALNRLSGKVPHFAWHRHLLRIEDCVFLHGDVVDAKIRLGEDFNQVLDAKRLAGELREPPSALSHALYDAAIRARVHRLVVQLAKPQELVLRRLLRYLQQHELSAETGVARVYFGHTHKRMQDVPFAGMRFSNPGAAIKGLPFDLIKTEAPRLPIECWKRPSRQSDS